MASRYVPCRDLAHVLEMYDAGLLCVNIDIHHTPEGWRSQDQLEATASTIERRYGQGTWIPDDFAYLVEED